MLDIQKKQVRAALAILKAMQGEIKYAVEFEGELFGNAEFQPEPRKKRAVRYPRGLTRDHYMPFLEELAEGEAVDIPYGGFDAATLQSNIVATCYSLWGPGTYSSHRNNDTQCVELWRLTEEEASALAILKK